MVYKEFEMEKANKQGALLSRYYLKLGMRRQLAQSYLKGESSSYRNIFSFSKVWNACDSYFLSVPRSVFIPSLPFLPLLQSSKVL